MDNVCRLADMFMCPKRASVPAEFVAIQTEIGHVNRLKEQWIGTIGSGDVSATHLLIVESLLLGTSQSILSRMISGESGQISVELGVADAA